MVLLRADMRNAQYEQSVGGERVGNISGGPTCAEWQKIDVRQITIQNPAIQNASLIPMKSHPMKIRLEAVTDAEQAAAAARVRRKVFGMDWSAELWRTCADDLSPVNHLIARVLPEKKVIATLTLLDTAGNETMHEKYGLVAPPPAADHSRMKLLGKRGMKGMASPDSHAPQIALECYTPGLVWVRAGHHSLMRFTRITTT